MAALGGALLARATDDRIDSFTHKTDQGPNSYALRKPAEVLARNKGEHFDIGSKSLNPLNSTTFLNNRKRLDAFTVMPGARAAYGHFLDCIEQLSRLTATEALQALAAYIQERSRFLDSSRRAQSLSFPPTEGIDLADLIEISTHFVHEDPEGGRRGEALVASALDCIHSGVELPVVNNPHPGDVRVVDGGVVVLVVEVKQHSVGDDVAITLVREAHALGAQAALLAVFSNDHAPINRERVSHFSIGEYGLAFFAAESVHEFLVGLCTFSPGAARKLLRELPGAFATRLASHGVRGRSTERWWQLVRSRVRP